MDTATVDPDGDGGNPTVQSVYTYNNDGIRTSETVDGVTRTFLIDPHNHTGYAQVLQVATDGVLTRTFQLGHDVLAEYAVDPADLTPIVLLADGHGSTRLLADAAGITQAIYAYTAYGVELDVDAVVLSDPAIWTTDLRFSGDWSDVQSTGLQYLRERYYDCEMGRFLVADRYPGSRQNPQSLHKYLYCHGDPVNHVDPTGLFEQLFGYDAEAAIEKIYSENHWGDDIDCGKWTRFGPRFSRPHSLKPDILNHSEETWLEIKPFTVSGIAQAATQYTMYLSLFRLYDFWPEIDWQPVPNSSYVWTREIIFANVGGIIFYTDMVHLEKELAAVTTLAAAKALLASQAGRAVAQSVIAVLGGRIPELIGARISAAYARFEGHLGMGLALAGI
ncbi:MAG: RHS repeat-associated core domain-containing protein [Planctomycetota bacterium]